MEKEFSFKELYEVYLKTTLPIEVNGVQLQKDEVVAYFDKITLLNADEIKSWIAARGGFDNRAHVIWEDTKEVQLSFAQGIFSKVQFGLLSNAKLFDKEDGSFTLTQRETLESDEGGHIELRYEPYSTLFIYDKETGERIENWGKEDNVITIEEPYKDVVVDYDFRQKGGTLVKLGHRLIEGFLSLEGKSRVKDDITGDTKTVIIKIPKLKLMSELSIRLGRNATPVVGNFRATAIPTGTKFTKEVMEFIFLDEDIDGDSEL